jgi:hypothetical protein
MVLLWFTATGQNTTRELTHEKGNHYLTLHFWTGVGGQVGPNLASKSVAVSFPYTATDARGMVTNHVFQGNAIPAFHGNGMIWLPIGLEYGGRNWFISATIHSNFGNGYSSQYLFGAGYMFPLIGNDGRSVLVLKAGLNVYNDHMEGHGDKVSTYGSIDNAHQNLAFMGLHADSVFTYTTGGKTPHTYKVNAETIDISYARNEWGLAPFFTISTDPLRYQLHVSATISWGQPFSTTEGLMLFRNDRYTLVRPRILSNKTAGMDMTYPEHSGRTDAGPYRGFQWSFQMGWNFHGLKRETGKHR